MAMFDDEVLTADEAAVLLKVSLQTVLKESRDRRLPAIKIGREWRYSRNALIRHLQQYAGDPQPDDDATRASCVQPNGQSGDDAEASVRRSVVGGEHRRCRRQCEPAHQYQ